MTELVPWVIDSTPLVFARLSPAVTVLSVFVTVIYVIVKFAVPLTNGPPLDAVSTPELATVWL
jgi:hypothetical protein